MIKAQILAGHVAAWVIKCNPTMIYDLSDPTTGRWDPQQREPIAGEDEWSLGRTYRSGLMAPGDRCFFWVSGEVSPKWGAGLWGECEILDTARANRGGGRAWIDKDRMRRTVPYLPVRFRFLPRPVPKATIRAHPDLEAGELVRTPNRENPLALTAVEVAALDQLIVSQPNPAPITSSGRYR
jgi:hypothetical protein